MRRFLPILLIASFMFVMILGGTTYLSGLAGNNKSETLEKITVYTTLPLEYVSLLAEEYERVNNIQVRVIPLTEQELSTRLKNEADKPKGDVILAAKGTLEQLRMLGLLQTNATEQTDIIPELFKDDNQYWIGLWYDPMVFVINQDYAKKAGKTPKRWAELLEDNKIKLALTDFLAADASSNLYYSFTIVQGEAQAINYFKKIHPQVIQYAKFLSTPVRMAGMGECDIAIAVQSESLRYKEEGFPLLVVYPEEGTSFTLTGAALTKNARYKSQAGNFIDWLLQSDAQQILEKHRFYFASTNPENKKYRDSFQTQAKLFEKGVYYSPQERFILLDNWVQIVRLAR